MSNNKSINTNSNKNNDNVKIDYSSLSTDMLYKEVAKTMISLGVKHRLISKKELDEKFGIDNIRRLLKKGYLIAQGKSITLGRRL